jgi:glycosyltransferase involved in cell wall biosynthesis
MKKVLFVSSSLDWSGSARQLALIAAGLPRDRWQARVGVLGPPTLGGKALQATGVRVDVLGWRRSFDVTPFLALRRLLHDFQPDVIHAWGPAALRAMALLGTSRWDHLIVSGILSAGQAPGWADRWLLRHAAGVVAFSNAETDVYRWLGTEATRLVTAHPGVASEARSSERLPLSLEVSADARLVLCVGPLQKHKGFYDAIWALDILSFLFNNLQLVLVGTGPERERLQRFAHATGPDRRVHFTGPVPDLQPLLRRAEVVWVPSHRPAGFQVALEAMAAGRPVIAARVPGMEEIVDDGQTGYLFEPEDKAALARWTRFLLDNAAQGEAFGAAGQRRVAEFFSAAALVKQMEALYEQVAARKKVSLAS